MDPGWSGRRPRHVFATKYIWKSNCFLLFLKEQALKPCPGPRSRDLLHGKKDNSSVRPNLTDLVTKEGCDFDFSWKIDLFLLFLKEQALKPCSGPRSRDLLHRKKINSCVRPNLTDLVTKQGRARFCNLIGHVFAYNCLILDVSVDFPYCKRCVHAGPKREPTKHSLWEKRTAGTVKKHVAENLE